MLELLIHLLPTIFISCAIGVVLLNIRALFTYVIYVFSMAAQPKQLLVASQKVEQKSANSGIYKFSLISPFIRIWTLTRVLFFPDLDISGALHKNQNDEANWTSSLYMQKAQEQVSQVRIKTYSIAGIKDTSHFKSSYDPVIAPHISSEFAKAFPDLSKNLSTPKEIPSSP
jgi:hypothetical protein